jgi:hypothetical protein
VPRVQQRPRVVPEVQGEVEEGGGHGGAVHKNVVLPQVPPAGTHDHGGAATLLAAWRKGVAGRGLTAWGVEEVSRREAALRHRLVVWIVGRRQHAAHLLQGVLLAGARVLEAHGAARCIPQVDLNRV